MSVHVVLHWNSIEQFRGMDHGVLLSLFLVHMGNLNSLMLRTISLIWLPCIKEIVSQAIWSDFQKITVDLAIGIHPFNMWEQKREAEQCTSVLSFWVSLNRGAGAYS